MENKNNEDITFINHYLRGQARDNGLCDKWYEEWKGEDWSYQTMIDKYIEGIDFCIEHDFPKAEFITSYFPKDLLRKNGILVNDNWSLLNPKYAVLLENSNSTIRLNGWQVSQVYLRGISTARIHTGGHAHVIVHLYDEAGVHILCHDCKNRPVIIMHGKDVTEDRISYEIGQGAGIEIKREDF